MEKYIGVKEVEATPMTRIEYNNYRVWEIPVEEKGMEHDEGYLVEYLNSPNSNHPNHKNYISWSPKEVFEESYKKSEFISYGFAIEAMRKGHLVARKGWNGNGMFVCKQIPNQVNKDIIPKMTSLPDFAKLEIHGRDMPLNYQNQMVIVKPDNSIDSWVASSSDTFAVDWYIVK